MRFYLYICLLFLILSCKDNNDIRLAENLKDTKKKEVIFANINKAWVFNTTPTNATSQTLTTNWTEWRIFLDEMSKKDLNSEFQTSTYWLNCSRGIHDWKVFGYMDTYPNGIQTSYT